ncbi:MAG: GNAT family N-acetyltransferase [Rubrobacter sp.]|nr:GNAT family N-acetyltransferase [Rubrobacter sp.]
MASNTVVRVRPEDAVLVAPLFDAYRTFYGQPPDADLAREFLHERLAREESVVFVALEGPVGIGFAQLYPSFSSVSARQQWILNDLFVAPEARGRGIGATLLEKTRQLATETGAKKLVLATAADNLPAQRLYESLGWKRDETFRHYYLDV